MTQDYKATPEQWRNIEGYRARRAFSDCSCLLELRARAEALEEAENDRRFEQAKAIIDKPAPSAAVIGEAFGGGRLAGFISHSADGHPTHALIVAPSANAQPEPLRGRVGWAGVLEHPTRDRYAVSGGAPMTEDYRTLVLPEVRDPAADLAALRVHVEGLQARVEALEVAQQSTDAPPSPPAPAGLLVERVEARAGGDARAALREVAAWLESSQWMWCASAAEVVADVVAQLRQEANRG
jgi:hypothetical protein